MNTTMEPKIIKSKIRICKLCGGFLESKPSTEEKGYSKKHKIRRHCGACIVELNFYKYHHKNLMPVGKDLEFIKEQRIDELDYVANELNF